MPVFDYPRQVTVTEGGGSLISGAALLAGATLVIAAAVVAFVFAHLLLLAICSAVAAVAFGTVLALMRRAARPALAVEHFASLRPAAMPMRAISAPQRAITAPAQHLHLHFPGASAGDIATILAAREVPARQAIEE